MINADTEKISESRKADETKKIISNEEIYKKLLDLEVKLKKIEERISKPLIG